MNFVNELNEQAERITKDLLAAKRAAKETKGVKAAYQRGRAEELEKWLASVESMITRIIERREAGK